MGKLERVNTGTFQLRLVLVASLPALAGPQAHSFAPVSP
jgi:hypothetical protein